MRPPTHTHRQQAFDDLAIPASKNKLLHGFYEQCHTVTKHNRAHTHMRACARDTHARARAHARVPADAEPVRLADEDTVRDLGSGPGHDRPGDGSG